ncbi:MAG TPA: monooxygenase [Mycobacteriales bacterium]|nr:monooxygenase [Mycobacteriales bacterium]
MTPAGADPVPALVTLHLWRVPAAGVPAAVARVARDRGAVRRTAGVRFAKLLGTGRGRTFAARDADLTRWGLLTTWADPASARAFDDGPVVRRWRAAADEQLRLDLRPVSSRGSWSGREPFGRPVPQREAGPVAAVTRARLRPLRAATFWRAVPDVAADLHTRSGLRFALPVGEAPLGLQGTVSLWEDAASLRAFAAQGAPHLDAVRRTAEVGWYAEELFARFAVLDLQGTVDGRSPL